MDTRHYVDNGDGTVTLRGWHHTGVESLPGILAEGLKPAAYGARAWGVGVYATLMAGGLRHAFVCRGVEILIEARVPRDRLVVVTEDNDEEMVHRYLTWGRNTAHALLVDIADESLNVSGDCACQFRVPPEAVRILGYRAKPDAGNGLYRPTDDETPLIWL